jgi:hypothetical protein
MGTVRIIVEQIKSEISAPDEVIFAAAKKRIRASGLFSNAGNLGGVLNTFTYNALSLSGYARLIPTETMTLPKMLNRGVFVNGNGVIAPGEGASLRIECPITMNGTLHKAGLGVLEMAGEIR